MIRVVILCYINCLFVCLLNFLPHFLLSFRVRTDPGKSWNFIVQNSTPWKVLEKGIGPGKAWKILESRGIVNQRFWNCEFWFE